MDWLGAMFEGIGKTFEAGANVNLGQMNERNTKRQLAYARDALDAQSAQSRLEFLISADAGERKLLIIVLVSVLVIIALAIIFRKK